jgi:hypothetical protein
LEIDSFFIYNFFLKIFLGFLFAVAIIYSIYRIFWDQRKVALIRKLFPLFAGLIFISTIPLISYLSIRDRGKKTILYARGGGGTTEVFLELRDDGTLKMGNVGPLGGQLYRGEYKLQNDTLRINNGDKNLYPTLSFIVKNDSANQLKYFESIKVVSAEESYDKLYFQMESNQK